MVREQKASLICPCHRNDLPPILLASNCRVLFPLASWVFVKFAPGRRHTLQIFLYVQSIDHLSTHHTPLAHSMNPSVRLCVAPKAPMSTPSFIITYYVIELRILYIFLGLFLLSNSITHLIVLLFYVNPHTQFHNGNQLPICNLPFHLNCHNADDALISDGMLVSEIFFV